jgi:cell wall assembly regulator SMI1
MNQLLQRLDALLSLHVPSVASRLRPGVDAHLWREVEQLVGEPVPSDIKTLYVWHDGCSPTTDESAMGLFGAYQWLPLSAIVERWQWDAAGFDASEPYLYGDQDGQWDDLPVRPWQTPPPHWLLLAGQVGRPASVYLDLAPGPKGVVGQLVAQDVDSMSMSILCNSLHEYLNELVLGLESGTLVAAQNPYAASKYWMRVDGKPFAPPGMRSVWG